MATKIQVRRGTSSEWSSANPTLSSGEIGFETNTNKFKIGNGLSQWLALPYAAASEAYVDAAINGLGNSLGNYVLISEVGVPDGIATLDSTGNVPVSQLGNVVQGGTSGEQVHIFAMIG